MRAGTSHAPSYLADNIAGCGIPTQVEFFSVTANPELEGIFMSHYTEKNYSRKPTETLLGCECLTLYIREFFTLGAEMIGLRLVLGFWPQITPLVCWAISLAVRLMPTLLTRCVGTCGTVISWYVVLVLMWNEV